MATGSHKKNEAIELVRRSAHLLHGSEYPEIAEIVNAIIREEKKQSPYYRQVITSYLHALVYEMCRLNEVQTQTRLEAWQEAEQCGRSQMHSRLSMTIIRKR